MTTAGKPAVSRKTVKRLSLYRRLLDDLRGSGTTNIFSHQLAHLAGVSATQVRRDFMVIGYSGSPSRGYQVDRCMASIESLLDGTSRQDVALVGLGRLGHSVLTHFAGRRPLLRIAAGFDTDPAIVGTSVEGCPVYGMGDLERVVTDMGTSPLSPCASPTTSSSTTWISLRLWNRRPSSPVRNRLRSRRWRTPHPTRTWTP
jgi:redox-sensing transcriptional repressor